MAHPDGSIYVQHLRRELRRERTCYAPQPLGPIALAILPRIAPAPVTASTSSVALARARGAARERLALRARIERKDRAA